MAATGGAVRLTVHAGKTSPKPLPAALTRRLRSVRVTETDSERSVFTLTFDTTRTGAPADDLQAFREPPLTWGSRVCIVVTFGAVAVVLADGIITELDAASADRGAGGAPGQAGGTGADRAGGAGRGSTLNVTGEDVSFLLDLHQRDVAHPNLGDYEQVQNILAEYAAKGIRPDVHRPEVDNRANAADRVPSQHDTDLRHLVELAGLNSFVCYMIPGPTPGSSTCYWGPPVRTGRPQPALSVDLGPYSNVVGPVSFRTSGLSPVTVSGAVKDPASGGIVPVQALTTRREPLAATPLWALDTALPRTRRQRLSGPDSTVANARAQAETDRSSDGITGSGTLDGARYGTVLRPHALVGVRGAGRAHDGLWYVQRVVHDLAPGSYRQSFTISREGYGSTVSAVRP